MQDQRRARRELDRREIVMYLKRSILLALAVLLSVYLCIVSVFYIVCEVTGTPLDYRYSHNRAHSDAKAGIGFWYISPSGPLFSPLILK